MEKSNNEATRILVFFFICFVFAVGAALAFRGTAVSTMERVITFCTPVIAEVTLWMFGAANYSARSLVFRGTMVVLSAMCAAPAVALLFPPDFTADPVGASPYVQIFFGGILGAIQMVIWSCFCCIVRLCLILFMRQK